MAIELGCLMVLQAYYLEQMLTSHILMTHWLDIIKFKIKLHICSSFLTRYK